jgi:ABC-type transporter Mla MlaB component
MAFSFFKKSDKSESGRVPSRPATAVDGRQESRPDARSGAAAPTVEPAGTAADDKNWDADFSIASTQPNGTYGIELYEETDPFAEIAEHAAILYANGQDAAARSTLEAAVRGNGAPEAVRLWAMLFDLLRLEGDRAAFDALGLEFARLCELSPPSWTQLAPSGGGAAAPVGEDGAIVLHGVLAADDPVLDELARALADRQAHKLDFSRLASLDNAAAARLADILGTARRRKLGWRLVGAEGLATRLAQRTVAGRAQDEALWLLLLELYLYLGWEARFEEKAVDYAVTFEVSPPSWEWIVPEPVPERLLEDPDPAHLEGEIAGEILQGDLEAIAPHLKPGEECRLDFSRVTRLDFVSAGALVNLIKSSGAGPVTIYHPNRLVAELMHVMGIDQVARIELARY